MNKAVMILPGTGRGTMRSGVEADLPNGACLCGSSLYHRAMPGGLPLRAGED